MRNISNNITKVSKPIIALGLIGVLLGLVAMIYPAGFGKVTTVVIGLFLIIGGSIRSIFSFVSVSLGSMLLKYFYAIIMLLAGIYMVINPDIGLVTLTMVLAIYFIVDGITAMVYSFSLMPIGGGTFLLISGILSIILGVMIFTKWPESSNYVLGVYLGIKLFIDGMMLALTGYSIRKTSE